MEDEEIVLEEEIDTSEADVQEDEIQEDEIQEDSLEAIKAERDKLKEIAENQRIRAEKAEAKAKGTKEAVKETKSPTTSTSDAIALINAKVHEDDIDRVERYAKSEGLSIKDALKTSELKAILSVRSEERDSAATANISSVRRGAAAVTADTLLENARAGKLPDSDEDIARLIAAASKK